MPLAERVSDLESANTKPIDVLLEPMRVAGSEHINDGQIDKDDVDHVIAETAIAVHQVQAAHSARARLPPAASVPANATVMMLKLTRQRAMKE